MDCDLSIPVNMCLGTLSEEFCKWSLYQIILGLSVMHEKKIIHRDIKCENILCKADGSVKLADFGMCGILSKQ